MATSANAGVEPIRVGVIADQTGPLSFVGLANANVARMVIGDINARGGLLGRHLELHVEDSATTTPWGPLSLDPPVFGGELSGRQI